MSTRPTRWPRRRPTPRSNADTTATSKSHYAAFSTFRTCIRKSSNTSNAAWRSSVRYPIRGRRRGPRIIWRSSSASAVSLTQSSAGAQHHGRRTGVARRGRLQRVKPQRAGRQNRPLRAAACSGGQAQWRTVLGPRIRGVAFVVHISHGARITRQLEGRHQRTEREGLLAQLLGGTQRVLDQQRVALRGSVHMVHGHVDLLQADRLFLARARDFGDQRLHALEAFNDLAHGDAGLGHLLRAFAYAI